MHDKLSLQSFSFGGSRHFAVLVKLCEIIWLHPKHLQEKVKNMQWSQQFIQTEIVYIVCKHAIWEGFTNVIRFGKNLTFGKIWSILGKNY
jgi:hypothetical protein